MKNIVWRAGFFMKYVLYFTLQAILWMFKFFPEKFVLTFYGCRKKVSHLARMPIEKPHGCGKRQRMP
jgi:hypothetical protein